MILRRKAHRILSASILDVPFYEVLEKLSLAKERGLRLVHLDVMDGNFVPQISFGLPFALRLKEKVDMELEAHLMVSNPEHVVSQTPSELFNTVFFHYEATRYPLKLVATIREKGSMAGIAINPSTPVEAIEPILGELDAVLVMLVEPGYGGQRMSAAMLRKVRELRRVRDEEGLRFMIACDGGIKLENAAEVLKSGADELIVGTGIFRHPRFPEVIEDFLKVLEEA
ncbi:MAG: ribulose-phosphate 3-epimerase [Desulfurococcaceae archaeon]